jgi:diguanylate cyclase (GGDEF)-like protein
MLCAEHLDPGDPEFVRVSALNAVLILLGAAGLMFAGFNALVIGTDAVRPLIVFDLAVSGMAAAIGLYLWRTHDIDRSARAANLAGFAAFLVLVVNRQGGEYFAVWAMVYPPLALMLVGMRRGLLYVAAFFVVLMTLALANLGVWNHGNLNAVAISNLAGAALALTGIVAIYHGAQSHARARVGLIRRDLENLSIRDGLTGLYNRRWFNAMLRQELARGRREQRDPVLLVIDVDHFKAYNDRFGHPAGDRTLISIAGALSAAFRRANDFVFRLGGEEFAVICLARTSEETHAFAETARVAVENLAIDSPDSDGGRVTVSVGAGSFSGDHEVDADTAYTEVDLALYRAKHAGRNRVVCIDPPVDAPAS